MEMTALRNANSPPGRSQILEALIFQCGFSSSQNVSSAFLKAMVLEESRPKIFEATMRVEPEGRLSASLWVCTARPLSNIPSSVEVFTMRLVAEIVCSPAQVPDWTSSILPLANKVSVVLL